MRWGYHKRRLKEYDKEYERRTNKLLSSTDNINKINKVLNRIDRDLDRKYADSLQYRERRKAKQKSTGRKLAKGAAIAAGAAVVAHLINKKINNGVGSSKIDLSKTFDTFKPDNFSFDKIKFDKMF